MDLNKNKTFAKRSITKHIAQLCLILLIVLLPHISANENEFAVTQQHYTDVVLVESSFIWTVRNFSIHHESQGFFFESLPFETRYDKYSHTWKILLYPRGFSDSNFLSVYIEFVSGRPKIVADYKISILNSTNSKIKTGQDSATFYKGGAALGFQNFIRRDYVLNPRNNVLKDDVLNIRVEVTEYRIWEI